MVRPSGFGRNEEAAGTNAFMRAPGEGGTAAGEIQARALEEFEALAAALRESGVRVAIADDPERLPDSIFPNNWFTTHLLPSASRRGAIERVLVTYPMLAASRRRERREGVFDAIRAQLGVEFDRRIVLESLESEGEFLEGTGSLVLDRVGGVAYAVRSPRTCMEALGAFARATGYRVVAFGASMRFADGQAQAIYHTNVMMSMGRSVAIWCPDSVSEPGERRRVERELLASGRAILEITPAQVHAFAGNVLELTSESPAPVGGSIFAISARAFGALTPTQRSTMRSRGRIVSVPIPTIEDVGGGGVRCTLAEVFA
jgi:hypothetical protein